MRSESSANQGLASNRIAVRNIVSAGRMFDARERGLGGRGGRRQAVSAAFIAFSNRGPPKSDGTHRT